MDLTTKNINIS